MYIHIYICTSVRVIILQYSESKHMRTCMKCVWYLRVGAVCVEQGNVGRGSHYKHAHHTHIHLPTCAQRDFL